MPGGNSVSLGQTGNDLPSSASSAPGIAHNQVTVTTTAIIIAPVRASRKGILIVNHGAVDVYIGAQGVTSSTGMLLVGTKGAWLNIESGGAIYAITASGSATISFNEAF
jgi:hypothetical protein